VTDVQNPDGHNADQNNDDDDARGGDRPAGEHPDQPDVAEQPHPGPDPAA